MTETGRRYGTGGAVALVAAGVAFGAAVTMAETGESPTSLTRGVGSLGVILFVVGVVGLLAMLFDVYGEPR